jgi:hypothetical protein
MIVDTWTCVADFRCSQDELRTSTTLHETIHQGINRCSEIPRSRLLENPNSREFGNIVTGDFTPVLAKHTKSFNLIDTLSVGVDRIQRNFEPSQRQVELWRKTQITDDTARPILYTAFIDGKLEAPRRPLPEVHRVYFEPQYEEFSPRTMWSLFNAFTSTFKKLDPVPQFKATAKLGEFLSQLPAMIHAIPFTVVTPRAGSAVLRLILARVIVCWGVEANSSKASPTLRG